MSGSWEVTTWQAGTASTSGCYQDEKAQNLGDNGHNSMIFDIIERLSASADESFNTAKVSWRKSRFPFLKNEVGLSIAFDPEIVPRGPGDTIYQIAAAARRDCWDRIGQMATDPLVETIPDNMHAQTKWFGPHRRVYLVENESGPMLVTDGLSTPWAGISDKENGVEAEVIMMLEPLLEVGDGDRETKTLFWAQILGEIGDFIADGYRIANEVKKYQAIVFCRLQEECSPYGRMVLSAAGYEIDDLPFGPATVLLATPIPEPDISPDNEQEDWLASVARSAIG